MFLRSKAKPSDSNISVLEYKSWQSAVVSSVLLRPEQTDGRGLRLLTSSFRIKLKLFSFLPPKDVSGALFSSVKDKLINSCVTAQMKSMFVDFISSNALKCETTFVTDFLLKFNQRFIWSSVTFRRVRERGRKSADETKHNVTKTFKHTRVWAVNRNTVEITSGPLLQSGR